MLIGVLLTGLLAATTAPITFHKDVAPILQKRCQGCHRPGETAPMSLLTYEQTRPWAKAIREVVLSKRMPPWFADPNHGKFSNDRSLPQAEIATLAAWADGGARAGDPKDAPQPLEFAEGWSIGKPDVVLEMPLEFPVPAEGTIDYRFITIPTGFTEDRWVQAAEMRPTDRSVVHHAVVFVREPGSRALRGLEPGRAVPIRNSAPSAAAREKLIDDGAARLAIDPEILSVYVPGTSGQVWKPGQAKLIKAGSDLVLQMHYTSNGKPVADRTRVGLIFAAQPPAQRVFSMVATNQKFRIPPGAPAHRVEARFTLEEPATLSAFFPHMHVRGKAFEYRAVYPGGETAVLLRVPSYDFNWQLFYYPEKPIALPKGTRLECTAWFDNSPNKPGNPDPTAEVFWGDQSWEEMAAGFMDFVVDAAADPRQLFVPKKPATGSE